MTLRFRDGAAIAVLQVHAEAGDPIVVRLRAEAMLNAVDLQPRALPPAAILCVHELRDPLPRTVPLSSRELRPPAAWEIAVQREIDRLAADASWPARGAVPSSAAAVAFTDEAEMLACLASDVLAHRVPACWWWSLLVGNVADPPRAAARAFISSAEHAPAALGRLARSGEATRFVTRFDESELVALGAAIARTRAAPVLAVLIAGADLPARAFTPLLAGPATRPGATSRLPPPWALIAPEAEEETLAPAQRALLGISLALVRAPALARSAPFAAAAVEWRSEVETRQSRAVWPGGNEVVSRSPVDAPATRPEPPSGRPTAVETIPVRAVTPMAVPSVVADVRSVTESRDLSAPAGDRSRDAPALPDPARPPPARTSAPPRHRTRSFGPGIETELGGLFYLLNLAVYLGFYGDGENLPLSPWDFVELTGERLLGGRDADPVWPLLASLSGRGDEPAGAHFMPSHDWSIPADWPGSFAVPEPSDLPDAPLERWLALLLLYLRARLRVALGLEAGEDPAPMLLRHHAWVHATETHVDVVLSLEALPIEVRLAGLDRDPGWIAAAGRFVAFHFE